MKILLPILVCPILLLAAFCTRHVVNSPQIKTNNGLKGTVKSVFIYSYDSAKRGSQIDSDWTGKIIEIYNIKGKTTANYFQNKTGAPVAMFFHYDNDGREIDNTDASGKQHSKSEYSISPAGNLIQKMSYSPKDWLIIIYNKLEQRDTECLYVDGGVLISKTIYHYDSNNNLKEQIKIKSDNSIGYREEFTYDKNHNMISGTRYDRDGNLKSGLHFTYDKYGNIIMQADSNNFYRSDLDPYDNLRDGRLYIEAFAYSIIDKNGNWLHKDILVNGVAIRTVKRKIEYYK